MQNETMRKFLKDCLFEEIIPTLDLPEKELEDYANSVLVRFENPYIKHYLMSIALNSVSKFTVRVLPSIKEYYNRFGKYPKNLVFGFSKLIEFYKNGTPDDSQYAVDFIKNNSLCDILANKELWGEDLSCLYDSMKQYGA